MLKRGFDLAVASVGLLILAPLMLAIALWVRLDSAGPAIFRQERIGRASKPFRIHKFRTMVVSGGTSDRALTVGCDPRITRAGRLLRHYKLDELPQLFDVLRGKMSLVGPRPEVPKYVDYYPKDIVGKLLSIRPGITDLASLQYLDENEILAAAANPEREYLETVLPRKLQLYSRYVDEQSFWLDLRIIAMTLARVLRRR